MDAGKLKEVEAVLLGKIEYYAENGYWESVERISAALLNLAAIRAIEAGGRVRTGPGGPVVDPPRGRD